MPKILFIANVDWFFISHRLQIALAAQRHGYETHLACTLTQQAELLAKNNIISHKLEMSRTGTSLFAELLTIKNIAKIIEKVKPDIVHLISIKPILYGGLICRLRKIRNVVVSVSGLGYVYIGQEAKVRILRLAVSLLYRLSIHKKTNRVIFQNKEDLEFFLRIRAARLSNTVIVNGSGVDLTEFRPSFEPSGIPVAMLVCRLLEDKGVREFVEAAKILKQHGKSIRLVIVGGFDFDNPKKIKESEINDWEAGGWIEYWGFSNNVALVMQKANIIVLPSYREGMPKSLLEAAASARAVITTDVPGCRDAVIPEVTGLLVPVKDPISLAAAIEKLSADPRRRGAMAKEGRLLAERSFGINGIIDMHLRIYDELVRNRLNRMI